MKAKKIVLILSFFLVVGLLFGIVFMAKNQIGNFGKDYDRYVSTQIEKYVAWFTNERAQVYKEVQALSSDKLVSDLIESLYKGEDITPYATQIDTILQKVSHLKKVQILDPTGIVLYSTKPGEALVNRFVPHLLTQMQTYQKMYQQPFLRFVSTNEFLVAEVLPQEEKTFQIVMYYDVARFFSPTYGLMIPWGRTILVSKRSKGQQEAAKIVEYASVDPAVLGRGKKTIGGVKEVDGIQVVYFSRYENYISGLVVGIIVFAFVLLFLILYAFFRLLQEEKMYQKPLTFHHPRQDLKDLVEDIEEGNSVSTEEAKRGIEEMLMSEDIEDLTRSSAFPFETSISEPKTSTSQEVSFEESSVPLEKEGFQEMETPFLETPTMSRESEPSFETFEEIPLPKQEEEKDLSNEILISEPPSLSGVSANMFQPDQATQFFAEQDHLLDELSEEKSFSSQDTIPQEDVFLEPSFASLGEGEITKEELVLEPEFMSASPEEVQASSEEKFSDLVLEEVSFEQPTLSSKEEIEDLSILPEETPSLEVEPETLSLEETFSEKERGSIEEEISVQDIEKALPEESLPSEEITLSTVEIPELSLEEVSSESVPFTTHEGEDTSQETNVDITDNLLQGVPEPIKEVSSEEDIVALNTEELLAIPVEETEKNILPDSQGSTRATQEGQHVEIFGEKLHQDLAKLLSEPPVRISSIHDVSSYAQAAHDIATKALGMNRISVLERRGETFENIMQEGFSTSLRLSNKDPLYKKVLAHHKSLDIRENLEKASYLKNWFRGEDLKNLEELFITPVIRDGEVVGIGIYGREKGTPEPTDLQKSELYNIGFLQQEG